MKYSIALFRCIAFGVCLAATNSLRSQVVTASLFRSFSNPTPENVERFGSSVAALGGDRVLIAAYQDNTGGSSAGAVYLFSTNGTSLTIFSNPVPSEVTFGYSLASIGTDKILVGSPSGAPAGAGKAYLFTTNRLLLTVFTNPEPVQLGRFGAAVTAINEIVAIAANGNGKPPQVGNGAVYLYSTENTLITTLTNPNPDALFDGFGYSLAAFGPDSLVVGAPASTIAGTRDIGAAYLFSTNGSLLHWFTNPTPAAVSGFGTAAAQLDTERVLISARRTNNTGIVYLFNTNGTQLATFSIPGRVGNDLFGTCITVLGAELILIGAPQDTPGDPIFPRTGAAYVFNTNGTLLSMIANPSPQSDDHFGWAVAVIGTNQVLIGAEQKSIGGARPGAAYLFILNVSPSPALTLDRLGNGTVRVWWPYPSFGFVLEQSATLNSNSPPATNFWSLIPPPYQRGVFFSNGIPHANLFATLTATNNQFYRLRQP